MKTKFKTPYRSRVLDGDKLEKALMDLVAYSQKEGFDSIKGGSLSLKKAMVNGYYFVEIELILGAPMDGTRKLKPVKKKPLKKK